MRVEQAGRLDQDRCAAILGLAEAAARADEVAPLSEHVLLHVRGGAAEPPDAPPAHFLAYDGTRLVGYAHLERGEPGDASGDSGEVVVHPDHRRAGVGRALLHELTAQSRHLRLWSHGHLDAAREFAASDGFTNVRELWQMRRLLGPTAQALPEPELPAGFATRTFVPGQDEEAWLRVNARAFANHPEQGRMSRADLDQRIAESWFDPAGFFLVEQVTADGAQLAGFHWTKVHRHAGGDGAPPAHGPVGEVYVVGVDPAYQGLGLGRAVTLLGLHHLQRSGLTEAMLYVDADNAAAVATYRRLGFVRSAVDVMYSPAVHPPVPR